MGDVVNLNQYRKQSERAAKEQRAAANRARTGQTKADRQSGREETVRRDAALDAKKLEGPRGDDRSPDEPDRA